MTLARQPVHTPRVRARALLVSGLALSALFLSVDLRAAEPVPKPKPAAAADRAWLRTPAPKPPVAAAPSGPSRWRVVLMTALVLGLGGAAVYIRRQRRVVVRAVRSELTVLTSTRVGPKAQVVAVSVSGRKLLLGVTDSHVSSLGWLDSEPEGDAVAPDDELPAEAPAAASRAALEPPRGTVEASSAAAARITRALRTAQQADTTPPRRFRDALRGALGKADARGSQDPAVLLASATEDVVSTRGVRADEPGPSRVAAPAGAPDMVDIEGQARGLVLRLQKRGR